MFLLVGPIPRTSVARRHRFCRVQPSGFFYAHIVQCKEWDKEDKKWVFWISNIEGRSNGWCWIEDVYGKLFSVAH